MDIVSADEQWRRYAAWKAANQDLERIRSSLRMWQTRRCAAERAAREARDRYREALGSAGKKSEAVT